MRGADRGVTTGRRRRAVPRDGLHATTPRQERAGEPALPAYYLYRHPDRYVGIASYGADLAYTLSRAARENYERGGGQLHKASRAVKHWLTRFGGGLWAAGVGGPATGKGFHLGIIDDLIKDAKEASSEAKRSGDKDWYGSVFSTREEPGGAIVVVQTRWHEDDLSGYLLTLEAEEPEHWYVVNLPAIADSADLPTFPESCTVHPDWREDGEPLCPERYPLERLRRMARRIGEYFFGRCFSSGRGRATAGCSAARSSLSTRCQPAARRVRYWDKAGAAPGKGDWTVGVLVAYWKGITYIEDVVRGQWSAAERNAKIRETATLDKARGGVKHWIEQPPGLAKESTDTVIKLLQGFVVAADPVQGDKAERAEPFAAQWQAGNVKLVKGEWNRTYLEELRAFPTGKNDDQVDGSSGGYKKVIIAPPSNTTEAQSDGYDTY